MTDSPALIARGVTKRYGGVEALHGADFECYPGQVTALIGDNGAGKSTLIKIISGVLSYNEGSIEVAGKPYRPANPMAAQDAGVHTVYQDLALAPDLSPTQNIFLGREIRKKGFLGLLRVLDDKEMRRQATNFMRDLEVTTDPNRASVRDLSGGQRQGVAVARAVAWAEQIILLDEPTAALGVKQTGKVLELVRRVADAGPAVVLVSHNMPEVLDVADRIEVLRLGHRVASYKRGEATIPTLVEAMTSGVAA